VAITFHSSPSVANFDLLLNEGRTNSLFDNVTLFAKKVLQNLAVAICVPATWLRKFHTEDLEHKESYIQRRLCSNFDILPVKITTADGVVLDGKFLQSRASNSKLSDPCVIFMQPNGASFYDGDHFEVIREAAQRGVQCNFLLFDYRSVGGSEGVLRRPEELILDGDAALSFVKDHLKVKSDSIHCIGHSLGAAVAAQVLSRHGEEVSGRFIHDRSFTSFPDAAKELVGSFAKRLLTYLGWTKIEAKEALRSLKTKTLIVYQQEDGIIKNKAHLYSQVDTECMQKVRTFALERRSKKNAHMRPFSYIDVTIICNFLFENMQTYETAQHSVSQRIEAAKTAKMPPPSL
jgi:alpha/beta superfamily hydrolase